MARLNLANNIELVLSESITDEDAKLVVSETTDLPETPFPLTINREEEIVYVTEVDGDTLTVDRAQEGTEAKSYDDGTVLWLNFTAGVYERLETSDGAQDRADSALDDAKKYADGEISKIPEPDLSIPSGVIVMWSGEESDIPEEWSLCDGSNGTPNLIDRFVVSSGDKYNVGDTGGEDSITISTSQLPEHSHGGGSLETDDAGNHTHSSGSLETNSSGEHTHSLDIKYLGKGNGWIKSGTSEEIEIFEGNTGRGGEHSHSITGNTNTSGKHSHSIEGETDKVGSGESIENRPPFYALAFIMKD